VNSKKHKTKASLSWDEIYDVYERVAESPRGAQEEIAASLCGGRPDLLEEVVFLIRNHDSAHVFLEESISRYVSSVLCPPQLDAGTQIEDFEIKRVLGRGGFATVYLARQISLDREVALKVSPIFGQEGRTIAQLEHEGIVGVFSETSQRAKNLRLIAMQYIPSLTLETLENSLVTPSGAAVLEAIDEAVSRPQTLTAEAFRDRERIGSMDFVQYVAWLGSRLAEALGHAHSQGILHLDVKPSNILVPASGRPKLTDFNVSSDLEQLANGLPANFGGTADYMSPEHKEVFTSGDKPGAARKLDGRSDVYSLGVVLKRLLALDRNRKHREEIDWIVDQATQADPNLRFPDARAFARALEGVVELQSVRHSLPKESPLARHLHKHPLWGITLVGAVPQVLAGIFGISYNSIRIVGELSLQQQQIFRSLNYIYNPILYFLATAVWLSALGKLRPALENPEHFVPRQKELTRLREHALRLPTWGIVVTTLGWIPGAIVYPACLHYLGGGLAASTVGHLLISFVLSYLIALAYCFIGHQWVVLRVIYGRLWMGSDAIEATAGRELSPVGLRVRGACVLAAFIPLMGAALIILVGPDRFEGESYKVFRVLTTTLICLGAGGVSAALASAQEIGRLVYRFTTRSRSSTQR
jgi:eukaryotic-like serine/threonine-protein kinase